jgi:hypothetical protein
MSNDTYQHQSTFCQEVKDKKLSPYVELTVILENVKMKEDLGIEELYRLRLTINMLDVEGFRESIDDNGNLEPFVMLYMKDGKLFCIDLSYDNFKILFKKHKYDY